MRTKIILPMLLALSLLTSMPLGITLVKATNAPLYVAFEVTSGPPLTGSPPCNVTLSVGQSVEFAAIPLFGTPPYIYQWSTEPWSNNSLDMMFTPSVDVPGATSQKLEYSETEPGSYEVCVEINDSKGNTLDASGPIVVVQTSNNTPSTSPSPTPIPSPSSLPFNLNARAPQTAVFTKPKVESLPKITVAAVAPALAVLIAVLFVYFKKHKSARACVRGKCISRLN